MKKVSAKMFFTVLWKGLCQALGWFFGLFGYKRDGKFAKCIWGMFVVSGATVMAVFALIVLCAGGEVIYEQYFKGHQCNEEYCHYSQHINRDIYFHNTEDGKGYIYDVHTGKKLLKHVAWIAHPAGKDSLICFSNGKKRGYFSKNTGKVVIEPQYNHAWIFSDGLASVEEDGYIKFIDATGKVVIDRKMAYTPDMEGYVFHGGYCIVDEDEKCGLIDRTGKIVLPMEYSSIHPINNSDLWCVQKGEETAVLDKSLNPVLPLMECSIYIDEGTIDVTMPDHTMRKYDMQGALINDFYISSIRTLEYEKDEILCHTRTHNDDGSGYTTSFAEPYHPKATARLRAYVAGDGYEGLMTADGHVVMMPKYKDIIALDYDLYLCTSTNYDKVIVNGKGELVR